MIPDVEEWLRSMRQTTIRPPESDTAPPARINVGMGPATDCASVTCEPLLQLSPARPRRRGNAQRGGSARRHSRG